MANLSKLRLKKKSEIKSNLCHPTEAEARGRLDSGQPGLHSRLLVRSSHRIKTMSPKNQNPTFASISTGLWLVCNVKSSLTQ